MYSVINLDISAYPSDFVSKLIYYSTTIGYYIDYKYQSIIRGSSTVNGDSAHDTDPLAKEHNYVSFYVRSIKIKYDLYINNAQFSGIRPVPGLVILFKLPYKDDQDIIEKLIPTNNIKDMILYSHPECVLTYDIINCRTTKAHFSHFLNYNKPFIVGPNDYVGILYFLPNDSNYSMKVYNISSTAKVIFKPL